eukprot:1156551-Pelagomonas_calceolata.AAC.2
MDESGTFNITHANNEDLFHFLQKQTNETYRFISNMIFPSRSFKGLLEGGWGLGVWRWRAGEEESGRPEAWPTTLQIPTSSV